jgi:hypothetical protein
MSDITGTTPSKLSKKEARKLVYERLSTALAEYKSSVKEKKLKKVSKLFAADIAKAVARQKQKLQKPTKIKAVKNNLPAQSNANEAVV